MSEANRFGFVGPLGAGFLALLLISAVAVPAANLMAAVGFRLARLDGHHGARRQIFELRAPRRRRSISSGAIAAFFRSATAPSSRSGAMRWACISCARSARAASTAIRCCPISWCSSTGRSCPGTGRASISFPSPRMMVVLVPGILAFVFGWFAFRSRVTGVYLSIITQAMTYALQLAFFRNDMGFGGNNGMTDFKDILGFPVQARCDARRLVLDHLRRARLRLSHLPGDHELDARQGADRGA